MRFYLLLFFISTLLFISCEKKFRSPSEGMAETIGAGDVFTAKKTSTFNRNDIVVFDIWEDDPNSLDEQTGKFKKTWQKWIKRLIAISGDSVRIENAEVIVNGKDVPDPPGSLSEYDLYSTVHIDDFPRNEPHQTRIVDSKGDTIHYCTLLRPAEAENYRKRKPAVVKINKMVTPYNSQDTFLICPFKDCQWSVDNFGPLKIPSPGDTINVTHLNYKLYQQIPGIQIGENVIVEKLYFVMGDNRHWSKDSRYVGYISHSKMYGIVK